MVAGDAPLRRLLVLVCAIQVVDSAFLAAIVPLLPEYVERLDLGPSGAGRLVAAFAIGALVAALPAGLLTARLGVRPSAALGLAILGASSIAFGFGDSPAVVEGARFFQGVGSATAWTAALAWLAGAAPLERRGRLLGIAIGATVAGSLLGPAIAAAAEAVGTGTAFSAVGAVAIALVVPVFLLPAARPDGRPPRPSLAALREPRLALGIILFFASAFLFGAQAVAAPLHLASLGWGVGAIAAAYAVAAALEAATNPLAGRWADARSPAVPARALLGLGIAACALVATPAADGAWSFAALVVASSIAFATLLTPGSLLVTAGADAAGIDHGYALALGNLAWAPGAIVGSLATGAVIEWVGVQGAFLVLAGCCAAAALATRQATA